MSPIVLATYDAAWPAAYEAERAEILTAIGGVLADIAHVGSTAVTGLAARPVIDIAGVVETEADVARCAAVLDTLGYRRLAEGAFGKPQVHFRLLSRADGQFERLLLFRDYLRTHPKHALHYQALKLVLAERCSQDAVAYDHGKSGFVGVIEALARAEQARG